MNNLKTLTAFAAVMLAGLVAPTAAADFACTYDQDLGALPATDEDRVLSNGDSRAYLIDATTVSRVLTITEKMDTDNVKVSIWKYNSGTCDEDSSGGFPIVGNDVDAIDPPAPSTDGESEEFTLALGAKYRVLVEDAESVSGSEQFTLAVV